MKMVFALLVITYVVGFSQGCGIPAFRSNDSYKVVGVSDGDTIKVLHRGRTETVRLRGIDCPEKRQAYGERAKQLTADLVYGKQVRVFTNGKDHYSRQIGDVELPDGRVLSQLLVAEGMCWWYRQYKPHDTRLRNLEAESRSARIGLWHERHPIPPWVFRRQRKVSGNSRAWR